MSFSEDIISSTQELPINYNAFADQDIHDLFHSQSHNTLCKNSNRIKSIWGVKYRLLNKLGSGHFGTVYLSQDTKASLSNDCEKFKVIKFISLDDIMLDESIDAVKEAKLLSNLFCPYIISFYDSFMEDSIFCIVTEYCEGGDLDILIKQHQKSQQLFSKATILDWLVQLALALKYIHQRNIIHRDLKTRNIFLKHNRIKLGDFGVSRIMKSSNEYAKTFTGTPYYMSPEVLKQEEYSFKSDIWSLGCIFYELLMLERPYKSDSMMSLFLRIVEDDVPQLPNSFPPELCKLSMMMLEKDPKKRPSAQEILQISFICEHIKSTSDNSDHRSLSIDLLSKNNEQDLINENSISGNLRVDEILGDSQLSFLSPREKMLKRKLFLADSLFSQRCELAQIQLKENIKLFRDEKIKNTTLAPWVTKANSFHKFKGFITNNSLNTIAKDNTNSSSINSFKSEFPKLYIPDNPKVANSFYFQYDDFEENISENNEYSGVPEEILNSGNDYDCMLNYMENALGEDFEMNLDQKDLLSVSKRNFSHEERIQILKNECMTSLGYCLYQKVYDFLKFARFGIDGTGIGVMLDEGSVQIKLSEITNNRNGCFLVDQLVFFEKNIFEI